MLCKLFEIIHFSLLYYKYISEKDTPEQYSIQKRGIGYEIWVWIYLAKLYISLGRVT